MRFKSEFRAIEDVEHPNLVGLGELFEEDGQWFFTMELVEGVDFLTWIRRPLVVEEPADERTDSERTVQDRNVTMITPRATASTSRSQPIDEKRLRTALVQLLRGLEALHLAGKVHRDVKPSNVLVTTEGRVVLLDFGLAIDARSSEEEGVVGTVSYMSPEQALGLAVDARADMYSVGVVLYRALSGQLPPPSSTFPDEPRVPILPPSMFSDAVPEDLENLCLDLLRISPELRPSATEALRRLGGDRVEGPMLASIAPPPPKRFIGRDVELAELFDMFDRTLHGESVVVAVTGESGLGKSTLVRHFGETVANEYGAVVLSSRCYERESVPYKAVDGLVDALARWLFDMPRAEALALLPANAGRLAQTFPALRPLVETKAEREEEPAPIEPRERRAQLFAAARALFANLAQRLPVVLVVDDLQWSDADGLALLHEVLRPPEAPSVLFVATLRSPGPWTGLAKTIREDAREVAVTPLSADDARLLALEVLSDPRLARHADAIAAEGRGHPLFIDALARDLLAHPASARTAPRLDDALAARVEKLDRRARALVEATCLASSPLRADVLAKAASSTPELVPRLVRGLQVARIARTRGEGRARTVEPYHDRVREAVIARIPPDEKRAWHRRIAEALEALQPEEAEALATHFQEANDPKKAAKWLAASAKRAVEALAYDRAASFERDLLALGVLDESERRAANIRLGTALVAAGRGTEAADAFLAAQHGAPKAEAIELQRRAAEQLLASGHIERGLAVLRPVLEDAGVVAPSTRAGAAASFAWHRAKLALRGLGYAKRDEKDTPPALLRRVDALSSAAGALGMVDTIRGADLQTQHVLAALEAGEARRLRRAAAMEASFSATAGSHGVARTAKLLAFAKSVKPPPGDPMAEAWPLTSSGVTAFLEGRWRDARTNLERADNHLRTQCSGDYVAWAIVSCNLYLLGAILHLGELTELGRRLPPLLDDATLRGDRYALTHLRSSIATYIWLGRDDPDTARREARAAIDGWSEAHPSSVHARPHMPHFFDALAQSQIDLYTGDARGAYERADAALRALRRALLLRVQFVRVKMHELRARTAVAAMRAGHRSPAMERRLERDIARIAGEGAPWASALAELLRASLGRGSFRLAASSLAASGMALHEAVARFRAGDSEARAEAREWLERQGVKAPTRLVAMLSPS